MIKRFYLELIKTYLYISIFFLKPLLLTDDPSLGAAVGKDVIGETKLQF